MMKKRNSYFINIKYIIRNVQTNYKSNLFSFIDMKKILKNKSKTNSVYEKKRKTKLYRKYIL